jgi:hypothetical protein
MGRADYGVSSDRLREVIARWFFMAQTTGRYTGSFESQFEQDVSKLTQVVTGDADGFCRALDRIVANTLGNDYWTITLPNEDLADGYFSLSSLRETFLSSRDNS